MNCIVIEDEKPAQLLLEEFIGQSPALKLVGTYGTALEAQSKLNNGQTDLLFLDINLPLISGIDLLKGLKNPPLVIITTAYPEYAIEGFNLDVVDYLLKPFAFSRFVKATNKALKLHVANNDTVQHNHEEEDGKTLILNIDKTLHKIRIPEIISISSDKDYVRIRTREKEYVLVGSLKSWEEKLTGHHFSRIHKSHMVNLEFVKQVTGNQLKIGNTTLPIGRAYKSGFMEKLVQNT